MDRYLTQADINAINLKMWNIWLQNQISMRYFHLITILFLITVVLLAAWFVYAGRKARL